MKTCNNEVQMSLLARYKRPGGFLQLVKLIEGFGKEKKEKFLNLLEQENSNWAGAVEQKVLTVDKIMSWKEQAIGDIVRKMHNKNVAAVMHGLNEEHKSKILALTSDVEKKHILDAYENMSPTTGEIASSMVILIEETREMTAGNYLKLEELDPSLVIPDDIEESLVSGQAIFIRGNKRKTPNAATRQEDRPAQTAAGDSVLQTAKTTDEDVIPAHELELMKRKIINLTKENALLKKENAEMASKLEQIKKIA